MSKTMTRKPFVTPEDGANPAIFDKNDFYDKSTYLTNVPRHKAILPFEKTTGRLSDLIDKGGDSGIDLGGKSCVFYDPDAKLKVMNRLEKNVPDIGKITTRVGHNSIYRREAAPDHYDSNKVAETRKRMISNESKPYVDMKKKPARDLNKMVNNSEFYKNI